MPQVSSAVATHPGLRRAGNEDAYCLRPDLGLYLVADGMGGHAAGEVASQMTVEEIEDFIARTRDGNSSFGWPARYDRSLGYDANRLITAVHLANSRLEEAIAGNERLRGMATTAAAVLLAESPVVAHVGDSRVYRWRAGALVAVTQDHSWVGEQVRAGMLTDADAQRHPWRNVVTRAIGGGGQPEVEVAPLEVAPADRLLLCTDGLSGVVPHDRIEALCGAGRPLQETCDALIEAANEAGGPDNITVLMLQVDVA